MRRVILALAALVLIGAAALALRSGDASAGAARCGVERWAVKTLQDPAAKTVRRTPRATSITTIRRKHLEATDGPRVPPFETTTWRVRARLVSAKIEDDSDVHLVIADPARGGTMIAEIPLASCAPKAPRWARRAMVRTRATLSRCGTLSSGWRHYPRGAAAVISGVGFIDRIHGQTGVAPNGAELHPVTGLAALRCGS